VISGVGGLGRMAIQYARAMGLHVAAVDVDHRKLDLAHQLGDSRRGQCPQRSKPPILPRQLSGVGRLMAIE
jgi:propanol-preferring alcohol dehydrogenase